MSEHEEAFAELGVPVAHGRQAGPPRPEYVAWLDDASSDGADTVVLTRRHSVTAYLVTSTSRRTDELCDAMESALDARGLSWSRQDRVWFDAEQRYQTTYFVEYVDRVKRI